MFTPTYKGPGPRPDFTGERERIAAHDARFHDARDNNGNQPTCPYCYETARVRLFEGKRGLFCGCAFGRADLSG